VTVLLENNDCAFLMNTCFWLSNLKIVDPILLHFGKLYDGIIAIDSSFLMVCLIMVKTFDFQYAEIDCMNFTKLGVCLFGLLQLGFNFLLSLG